MRLLPLLALAAASTFAFDAQAGCSGKPTLHDSSSSSVTAFVRSTGKKVLTFSGYSAAGYENPQDLRDIAGRILAATDPGTTLINIGGTSDGIGQLYEWAKGAGFTTIGVVSSRARDEAVTLAPCVDHVFFVEDKTWGGLSPDGKLSPTSQTIVDITDSLVGIGGGDIARDEMLAAQARGVPVTFFAAEMNHEIARQRAAKRGQPTPRDFRGSAHAVFRCGPSRAP